MIRLIHIILCTLFGYVSIAPSINLELEKVDTPTEILDPSFLTGKHAWADSIFDTLTPDQRIAQLFMVAAYSNKDAAHAQKIDNLVGKTGIGGLIFMQGTPSKQIDLNNRYQAKANVPLMISIDGEWGLPMRLKNTFLFPKQMTMGAIQHDSLIYQMGVEMAAHCKRMGIHVNFAPVIDVNNNPKNPIINYRSFGEDRENVARKGIAYMDGLQDNGVMACGKHFPGHGDTDADSHKSLPIINHDINRLDSIELYPFKKLINKGLGSLMVAHLYIPALDSTKNRATTLSPKVVNELLKDSLKFKGLVFTDALNMKGVSAFYKPGVVDVKALLAGNDVLLFSEDVPTAIAEIKKAIKAGEITQAEIDLRCRKILYAKEWLKTSKKKISKKNLIKDLNPKSSVLTNNLLFENALTLVKNESDLLPLKKLDTTKIVSLVIGDRNNNLFQQTLNNYTKVDKLNIAKTAKQIEVDAMVRKLSKYNTVIISVHKTRMNRDFGLKKETYNIIQSIAKKNRVILNLPTNPYVLSNFDSTTNIEAIIVSYEDNNYTKKLTPQLIFGGIAAKGKLPVSTTDFPVGTGIETQKIRLNYSTPESVGINSSSLKGIDSIVRLAILDTAFPGCQILVAKKGTVIYNKSFGYHTYNKKRKVDFNDLYDIASVTKVAVSTPLIMSMHEQGSVTLNDKLGDFLPDIVDSTAYENIVIKDMLAHQARFKPWIPFYTATLKDGNLNPRFYRKTKTSFYNTEVAKNMYIFKNYKNAIFRRITSTSLRKRKKYKYSDIGYYFLKEIIERKANNSLDNVIDSAFYKPLGLQYATYNPKKKFSLSNIIPTEDDQIFRKQLVHGYVHDQGAAMLGGIGGHAGIFSNANDMAILMQMYLNGGTYGGERFLKEETVKTFTSANHRNNDNRRGYGFDKPLPSLNGGPTCNLVSLASYGHSGFTGTRVWVDPKHDLVYIFLSNRVYPDATNWKLVRQDIRTKIEEVIYKSFLTKK